MLLNACSSSTVAVAGMRGNSRSDWFLQSAGQAGLRVLCQGRLGGWSLGWDAMRDVRFETVSGSCTGQGSWVSEMRVKDQGRLWGLGFKV